MNPQESALTQPPRPSGAESVPATDEGKVQEQSVQKEHSKRLRRAWCWGEKTFREELLAMIDEKPSEHHHGEELEESAEHKAERLLGQMLRKAQSKEAELAERRKADAVKVQMGARPRTEMTMSWKWIAQRLSMGHWASAANAVRSAG